jgi:hypothetical protein
VSRDPGRLEAARTEQSNIGVRLCDPGGPAGIQLDRENVTIRNSKALTKLYEGLSFASAWVEDVYVIDLESGIGDIRYLEVLQDAGYRLWRCRKVALLDLTE